MPKSATLEGGNAMFKSIGALALGALFLAAAVPGLKASDMDHAVTMSFSNAVQIPGMVLPAGTYVFRPLSAESHTVAIMNQDQSKTLGLELTIPVTRLTPPSNVVVHMAERPSTSPEAIQSWFYPGDSSGYEFIYPNGRAS
jgi:hypothetical protein